MTIEYLVDEHGKRSRAVIPLDEYERLIRMNADAEDIAEAHAALDEEDIPIEVVDRILAGENRVLVWREFRSLTQKALAERAGIRQASVSEIEAGKSSPRMSTARRLADVLDVDIDDLF